MSAKKVKFETVDEYISAFPQTIRETLEKVRHTIQKTAPDALETISYQIPAFTYGRVMLYFAAYKNHYSLTIPHPGKVLETFKDELSVYDISKSTIRFPIDHPFPFDLLASISRFRMEECREK
ncbi:iron chaperone [Mucilaginibacter paludis]|uniref:YdhG-like domain-containing protein n=1 Tax=Mucilaginibacter paludis DSM 18603 TaxID=714943 RepID=H1Y874_9SPHI|nr:DUF1801 domain-containing protein [Mucilaginibacter paludis]EHQ31096.1 protein of unknown function DUF1801 [Mucilaginibacter paludis DSM 18603]